MNAMLSQLLLHPRVRAACIGCAALMYLLIVVAGNVPGARADIGQYASGVVLHGSAYAVLACLCFLGSSGSMATRAVKAVLAVALMGAGDEFIQSFFPYRGADVHDWAVDCSAAILAVLALCAVLPKTLVVAKR
ncbi:VanZ family protein [Massilia norwichensis]|uniref:VanZ family protein n=1 Tax=Massilia norwichensis TaxID=1442366 RepID=A0ABT2A3U5_9BURK|nr:VanZ family protein [Massilia norwichensis]MCS0588829.1 VanZ family protein [Massilia norwichensis]